MPVPIPSWLAFALLALFALLLCISLIGLLVAATPTHFRLNKKVLKRSRLIFSDRKLPFPFSSHHNNS